MRMQTKITTRAVEALETGQTIFDTSIGGFGVRRQGVAARPTYFVKTILAGRQKLLTIGAHGSPWTVDSARREAKKLLGEVAGGRDPSVKRETRDVATTLDEFFDKHVVAKGRAQNTQREYRRQIDKIVKPAIGRLALSSVTRDDLEKLHNRLRKTPYMANRVLALLSKFFKWTEPRYRDRGTNPARDIERYREHQRHRDLDDQEVARVAAVLGQMEPDYPYAIAAIRLLLLTGCRRDEILKLRWDQVRLDQRSLRLPTSKTEDYKVVHLSDEAITILSALTRIVGNPFVICGRCRGQHLVGLGRIWTRILDQAKIEMLVGANGKLQPMRIHDFRHHAATLVLNDGATLAEVGRLLGHTSPQTTARYAKIRDAAAIKTSNKLGALMRTVIE